MEQHIQKIATDLSKDESIPADIRIKVISSLNAVPNPLQNDRWIYRTVVMILGLTVLITMLGGIIIYGVSAATIPGELVALGSAAVGALAGLLAPSPVAKQQ